MTVARGEFILYKNPTAAKKFQDKKKYKKLIVVGCQRYNNMVFPGEKMYNFRVRNLSTELIAIITLYHYYYDVTTLCQNGFTMNGRRRVYTKLYYRFYFFF